MWDSLLVKVTVQTQFISFCGFNFQIGRAGLLIYVCLLCGARKWRENQTKSMIFAQFTINLQKTLRRGEILFVISLLELIVYSTCVSDHSGKKPCLFICL